MFQEQQPIVPASLAAVKERPQGDDRNEAMQWQ